MRLVLAIQSNTTYNINTEVSMVKSYYKTSGRPSKYKSGRMVQVSPQISQETYRAVLRICLRRGITQADWWREAISEKVEREKEGTAIATGD